MKRWLAVPGLVFAALSVQPAIAAAATAPMITSQPDIGLVYEAGEVTQFSAHAEGTPSPTVRWQVATDRNGPWSNVTGNPNETTTTLVIAASTENLGDAYRAVFTNSAGTAISRPAKLISRADWMSNLGSDIENVPLNELTIPGAHDMGTYGFTTNSAVSLDGQISSLDCLSHSVCVSYGRAQDPSKRAAEMLTDGIRYFDLRVCGNNTSDALELPENWAEFSREPVTCHGLNGALLAPILDDTRAFALAHPKEVVILDVNHEYQLELYALAQQIEDAFALPGGKSLMISPQYCEAGNLNSGECASELTLGKIWQGHLGNVIVNFENDAENQKEHTTIFSHPGGAPGEVTFNLQPIPNYAFYSSFPNLWGRLNQAPHEQERCTEGSATSSCFGDTTSRDEANYWDRKNLETRSSFSDTRHLFIQFLQTTPTGSFIAGTPSGSLLNMAVSSEEGSNALIGPTLFECGKPESCFAELRPENINILALNFYNRTGAQADTPSEKPLTIAHFLGGKEEDSCVLAQYFPEVGPCGLTEAQKSAISCPGITLCYYTEPGSFDLIEESIRFDEYARTPPVVELSTSKPASANGWYNAAAIGNGASLLFGVATHDYRYPTGIAALSCRDGAASLPPFTLVPTETSEAELGPIAEFGLGHVSDGVHPITCEATDGAKDGFNGVGNSGAGPGSNASVVFKVDTHAPIASPTQSPTANSADWNHGNVTVNWNWTDPAGGSGIEPASCTTSSTSSGEGTITLSATCQDVAGNVGTASYTVKVDKAAPTAAPSALPAANGAGWNRGNVTVSWNWTDKGGSGIEPASCTTSSTSSGEGTITLSATCQDVAGNTGTASYTFKVDKIAPTVTYSGNAGTYSLLAPVEITCTPADSLSGVASSTCATASGPAWSFGAGAHTLSATATDVAGNVGTGSATFTVTVSSADLSTLTRQFVDGSAKYQAQTSLSRTVIDTTVGLDCVPLSLINSKLSAVLKQPLVATYKLSLQTLTLGGWLTSAQVTTLGNLAGAL